MVLWYWKCLWSVTNLERYIQIPKLLSLYETFGHSGGSEQDFEAEKYADHIEILALILGAKHDGAHRKRPTTCVVTKNDVSRFYQFYAAHFMAPFLR